ncbi:MAG: DUF2817 domain-containing protein [Gemmatimonadales bacterium]
MSRRWRHVLAAALVLSLAAIRPLAAQTPAVPVSSPTPAERADYLSFTALDEIGPYLARLSAEASGLEIDTLAGPVPLPIIRIAADPPGGEAQVVRVLVIGAQHGIERAGTEVALRLARDLAIGRLAGLRNALEVRIVPAANPWGVENRRRGDSEGVDLDADHVRLTAPETRALWAEYATWRPHLVVDLHELGPSEYDVQVAVPTHPNASAARRFARFYLLPWAANELARDNLRFHEYVMPWIDGRAQERAAVPAPDSLRDREPPVVWFTPPALGAATARNAFALAGSVTFFVAVSSSRDIIGLERRSDAMYATVAALLEAAAGQADQLVAAATVARGLPKDSLVLRARYVAAGPGVRMPWLFINARGQREQGVLAPWRPTVETVRSLLPPVGWWIAPGAIDLVSALRAHGFRVGDAPGSDSGGRVLGYSGCGAPDQAGASAEVGAMIPVAPDSLPGGSVWVPADQPGGRLLFTLVEPWSDAGWFASAAAADCEPDGRYPVYRVVR